VFGTCVALTGCWGGFITGLVVFSALCSFSFFFVDDGRAVLYRHVYAVSHALRLLPFNSFCNTLPTFDMLHNMLHLLLLLLLQKLNAASRRQSQRFIQHKIGASTHRQPFRTDDFCVYISEETDLLPLTRIIDDIYENAEHKSHNMCTTR